MRLHDRFVRGSSLRIRRVASPEGREILTKIGHKRIDPDAPLDPRRRLLTTIYLEPGEADGLAALAGPGSVKRRYTYDEQGWTWAIDVWEEPAARAGLVLAEVECDSDAELDVIRMPAWAIREVTQDPSFSAFELSRC